MKISTLPRNIFQILVLFALIILPNSLSAKMVSFFPVETETCPTGWSIFKPAQGYIIRGTDVNDVLGTQVGSPIEDGEPVRHQHAFYTEISLEYDAYTIRRGADKRAQSGDIDVSGATTEASNDLPFIQYMICEENSGNDHSVYLPENSVQWFNDESCPTDWEVYKPATEGRGRTLLPLPTDAQASDNGAVVGNTDDLNHPHDINIRAPDFDKSNKNLLRVYMDKVETKWDWLAFLGTFNRRYFAVDVHPTDGKTELGIRTDRRLQGENRAIDIGVQLPDDNKVMEDRPDPEKVLVPFIYLRPCIKKSDTRNIKRLPSGIGTFTTGFDCPAGLTRVSSSPGRYLVGLPPHHSQKPFPESGKVFGGKALYSKQHITHYHDVNTSFKANVETVDTAGIIRPKSVQTFSVSDPKLSGQTVAADMTFPYVQLRFCFKAE
jgi:hypothetical protein